ncbi:ATP-dependent DNA helicase RecG [Hoeflea prorocentri]|uniref:ATP-dependent DNA helicase RecG n=1 Tax=Hoeflea prorocentri TaxID=1922333 RepID=A0A9X3ZGH6_9HYPH|nr:ATP-dependent DNA helicase RecG [Hoeflea prorocentri]MCY6380787.1 ATP-dependent DNA helicase RecG [Hoeflea prorocentri]MDA5398587.1 ATP-dependent DNA helicase RecG [Hoeflea prorocentri]
MRPTLLDPLFVPVTSFSGVGPKIAALIARAIGRESADDTRAVDLVLLPPTRLIDRRNQPGIAYASEHAIVTLKLFVDRHQPAPRGKRNVPYRVFAHDDTGDIALTFFHARQNWLEHALPVGEMVLVSGKVDWFNGKASMVHPDRMAREKDAESFPFVEPVYPLTAGLSPKHLLRAVEGALASLPDLPEWQDAAFIGKNGFADFGGAVRALHTPRDEHDMDANAPAHRRLAYDELLAGQLSLALVRQRVRKLQGQPVNGDGTIRESILSALPFELTASQRVSISDILSDMQSPDRMLRLLQGDVGSGKTVVALLAMAACAEVGGQSVLMAPTEILAQQHYATIEPLARKAGLEVELLTGKIKGKQRKEVLERMENGQARLIVGTHALFQESVAYDNLLLAVVDEQHRFGVHQRLRLTAKGTAPHMLVMTATPIPRTLVLSAFGDMDVSKLSEKPAGRLPIKTVTIDGDRIQDVVARLREAVSSGRKAYWICPLVEDSEVSDLMSAEQRHGSLAREFGDLVGVVHGRMNSDEKDRAMADFKSGRTRLLVATTVIEVGVDVPDASIMVIEHAERFGLAQLHQLRGRVGRGSEASSCILLYKSPLSETARSRLTIMRESEDGFRIAEEDLKLRGEGELLGTRQSGVPGFQLVDLEAHRDLLEIARNDARYILETDADLSSKRGHALRLLLYIWRRDEAIRLLRAG